MTMQDATPPGLDPLPNRFTRATALGCLGILGVFALPIFLLLPVGDWRLPAWLFQLLELAAFAGMAGGIWLLGRVPASRVGTDPRRPLTRTGHAPLIERPATPRNRLALLAIVALALGIMGLYLAATSLVRQPRYGLVVALASVLGALCIALGAGIATGHVPVPAWRWERTAVSAPGLPQGLATCLLGAASVGWSLLSAASAGYIWGKAAMPLLVLVCVLLAPLVRRWPTSQRQRGAVVDTRGRNFDGPPPEDERM
jgi:hypothetical protein